MALQQSALKDELILALMISELDIAINAYYSPYFKDGVEVFDYESKILNLIPENYLTVTIGVTPQIGAHNPVGYDELTFSVDGSGFIQLLKYEHITSYEIPQHLQDSIRKPMPKHL